ncbi:MAG: extracellular solute-binding protein [Anaerolineales bacterium]
METIDFSIFDHGPDAIGRMRSILMEFERLHHVRVNLEIIPWQEAWSRLVHIALYNDGPDLSEVGSTWVRDLVTMNALRPFGRAEIDSLGGETAFLPAAWKTASAPGDLLPAGTASWAIPWLADTRLVYYRKDLFARLGLAAREAFANQAELEACLQALQEGGIDLPLSLPTARSRIILHILAGWIWAAGANFLSPDGRQAAFDSPEAVTAMLNFFRLGRFLLPQARQLDESDSDALFWQGRAAVTISGPWMFNYPSVEAALKEQFAVAVPPGVPFVGGFHLVIWKHTRREAAAWRLVEFLAGARPPTDLFPAFALPARLDILNQERFVGHPVYRVMGAAMQMGRSFPSSRVWGMIEDRLFNALPALWQQFFSLPESEFRAALEVCIDGLAQRINLALEA